MTAYELELAHYFISWLPYGGPSADETLSTFGIDLVRAVHIILTLMKRRNNSDIDEADHETLKRLAFNEPSLRAIGGNPVLPSDPDIPIATELSRIHQGSDTRPGSTPAAGNTGIRSWDYEQSHSGTSMTTSASPTEIADAAAQLTTETHLMQGRDIYCALS
jgi:hypothetical protein